MANQITIDIGAAANDGTGDPLRTAFNYVNNNFSNVWNTGLPTSNVQFSDNRILTVNTNANLVLAPNGIGKVASNVDIVPNTANVFSIGGLDRRWNTVYGQYLNLSHNAIISGNLVVTGNITGGNIHYTGNVFVGDLEGSVFDGASSVVLDVLTSSIYVDNYRYANGVPVTFGTNYSNTNATSLLAAFGSNSISTTGNITAGYFIGNGSQLTGIVSSYGNSNVTTLLSNLGANSISGTANITTTANITAGNVLTDAIESATDIYMFAGNGIVDIRATGNVVVKTDNAGHEWLFDNTGNLTAPGNVIFADNYVYSGNTFTSPETNGILKNFKWEFSDLSSGADTVTLQWNLLDTTFPQWYLTTNSQGNTYVFDGDAKTMGFLDNSVNSGTLTFGTAANNGAGSSNDIELTTVTGNAYVRTGSNSWKFGSTGNLTLPDGYTFGPSGSSLLIAAPATTDGIYMDWASEISFFIGNGGGENIAQIGTLGGVWAFGNDGVLTAPGNITTTGNVSGGNIISDGEINSDGRAYVQYVDIRGGYSSGWIGSLGYGGNIVELQGTAGVNIVTTGDEGGPSWQFGTDGTLTAPGDITVSGDITGRAAANTLFLKAQPTTDTYIQLNSIVDSTISIAANLDIVTDSSNTAQTFAFGADGNLFVPGNITGNVGGYEIGYRNIPQLVFAGDVQVSADDAGKHYYNASNTAYTMSLVDSGAVTYPVGMAVTIVNKGTGNIAVDAFPGVSLYLAGNATAGNRVVTSYGMATVLNVATDVWFISGAGVE